VVEAGLLGDVVMRPVMKGVFNKLMSGLAYHCVTGKRVGGKLSANEELANIMIG